MRAVPFIMFGLTPSVVSVRQLTPLIGDLWGKGLDLNRNRRASKPGVRPAHNEQDGSEIMSIKSFVSAQPWQTHVTLKAVYRLPNVGSSNDAYHILRHNYINKQINVQSASHTNSPCVHATVQGCA